MSRDGEIVGRDLAMIFQEPMSSLNPVYTVGSQIAEVLRLHKGLGKREALRRAVELVVRLESLTAPSETGMKVVLTSNSGDVFSHTLNQTCGSMNFGAGSGLGFCRRSSDLIMRCARRRASGSR